jgi:succinate dehydrogenase flavin-adding protein (antitoxin of CptAB toxin-antitoxin module)
MIANVITSSSDRELQQYRRILTASDDVLQWWRRQAETYPKLSLLAQGVLAVPETSAPSERFF